ncbi:Prolyl 3-hydroxylase 1, partial [Stegodyphus mimosarum]
MNYLNFVTVVSFLSLIVWVESVTENFKITYENLYRAGVDAYLENRWRDCVALIEKSVEDYIYYQTVIIQCRKRCQKNETENLFVENDQEFGVWYFQMIITGRALCLMKCQKSYFPNRPKASKETDDDFEKKVPYNYLQLCYF